MPKTIKERMEENANTIRALATPPKKTSKAAKKEPNKKAVKPAKSKKPADFKIVGEQVPEPPIEAITPSDKPAQKLVSKYLTFNEAKTGITVASTIPEDAMLTIFDELKSGAERIGFILGDFLVQCRGIIGDRFEAIMAASGRSISTLRVYEDTARSVPADQRVQWLSFSAAREVARLKNPEQQAKLIQDISATVTSTGEAPTVRDIRKASKEMKPTQARPKAAAKKAAASAHTPSTQPSVPASATQSLEPPYEPSEDEQAVVDAFGRQLDMFSQVCRNEELIALLPKMTNLEKREWNDAMPSIISLAEVIRQSIR